MQKEREGSSQNAVSPKLKKYMVRNFWVQTAKEKKQVGFQGARRKTDTGLCLCVFVWNLRATVLSFSMLPASEPSNSLPTAPFSSVTSAYQYRLFRIII